MADFFTRVPGPLEVMRRLGLNVPSSKQLGKFSTAVPEFVGPQADVAGMVRDAGQVMPNIQAGDYGQALANLGMAAAAIPFMAVPGTVSQVKGVTKKITDELPKKVRAVTGGELGVNDYYYKGGQFLPTTTAPPGTWRIKTGGKAKNIENRETAIGWDSTKGKTLRGRQPTPFSRSVYELLDHGGAVDIGADGVARLNPKFNFGSVGSIGPNEKNLVQYKNLAESTESFSKHDLIDLYNKGVRWIDTEPLKGVDVIAKGVTK